jgi:hypothetical protein
MLRTINNTIRTLLIHASMPPPYWAKALATATFLLNRRLSTSVHHTIPYQVCTKNFQINPLFTYLGVFAIQTSLLRLPHKLSPRSTPCVFLSYPSSHKGYHCLDTSPHRIIVS